MKKAVLLTFLTTIALAIPAFADNERERHQSYLSYDDGDTVVRSGEDGREIEAHRNLPIYPGDEVVTARRGRAEVRLSDGNIIGIDRATALRFQSMLDSYDGDGDETVVELRYGKVAVHRTDIGRDRVRLDTENASYVAAYEAVYSVETDSRGRDRVTVFDGSLEVRTPRRSTRLREGESANVGDDGVFDLLGDQRAASDDFERWFLQRAEKFGSYESKYMDRRLAYWSDDLDDHGRWVFVTGVGWSWRPYVSAGWRPYYNGYWYNRLGCLTWVSYDPWGWGPWHYGRWAFDPGYGWVWVPGYGYSPAWVYWMYGSGYVGWAPSGWWDCYRPYYNWAYNPYRNYGHRYGFGFYGRVRVTDLDMRPWTFVDSRGIISTRVDRAALTADAVKQRLGRSRDGFATVGGGPSRFTREEWNDPAEAIRRRGIDGRGTGYETGSGAATDMTPFFRRDAEVGVVVRDRVVRARSGSGSGSSAGSGSYAGGGSVAPIGRGSVAPIGGGSVAPIGRGSVAPVAPGTGSERRGGDASTGRVGRGGTTPSQPADSSPSSGSVGRGTGRGRDVETPSESDTPRSSGPSWRDRTRTPETTPSTPSSGSGNSGSSGDSWRSRVIGRGRDASTPSSGSGSSSSSGSSTSNNDAPRRVIDGVGGARIRPRDGGDSGSSSGSNSGSASSRSSGSSSSNSGRSSGSVDRGSRSSGGGSSARSSDGGGSSSRSSGSSSSGSSSSSRSNDSGGSKSSRGDSGGGKVKRD